MIEGSVLLFVKFINPHFILHVYFLSFSFLHPNMDGMAQYGAIGWLNYVAT